MPELVEEFIHLYQDLYEPAAYLKRAFEETSHMAPPPFKRAFRLPQLGEIRAVAVTTFRQGVLYSSRWSFWKDLLFLLVKAPARARTFITACILGEHLFEFRDTVKSELESQLRERRDGGIYDAASRRVVHRMVAEADGPGSAAARLT
jgi:hypothetical protein